MFSIQLAIVSAAVMFVLEYFVLLRVYTRSQQLQTISLAVAPLMIVVAQYMSHIFQTYTNLFITSRVDPISLFISLVLLELPLSLRGYAISPPASILERVVVAAVFGVAATVISESFMKR